MDWCCLTAHHRTYLEKLVLMIQTRSRSALLQCDLIEHVDGICYGRVVKGIRMLDGP